MGRLLGVVHLGTLILASMAILGSAHAADAPGEWRADSAELFKKMAVVLRDPRCMNCHTVTEFPRQGDDRHRHQQNVMRGANGRGTTAMLCSSCHQEKNSSDGKIPGAHNWHLAPLSMGWENLKTDKALCEAFTNRELNGDKNPQAIVKHIATDPLVLWAWNPGTRKAPPISKKEFDSIVAKWASTGASCPKD